MYYEDIVVNLTKRGWRVETARREYSSYKRVEPMTLKLSHYGKYLEVPATDLELMERNAGFDRMEQLLKERVYYASRETRRAMERALWSDDNATRPVPLSVDPDLLREWVGSPPAVTEQDTLNCVELYANTKFAGTVATFKLLADPCVMDNFVKMVQTIVLAWASDPNVVDDTMRRFAAMEF